MVFGQGGLAVGKVHRVDLVDMGEEISWFCGIFDIVDLLLYNPMHILDI